MASNYFYEQKAANYSNIFYDNNDYQDPPFKYKQHDTIIADQRDYRNLETVINTS